MEEKRPFQYLPVYEDERGTYILNSRDLCLIQYIPLLMELGIDAFKIEGRMKGLLYGATVTKIYREAVDSYNKDPLSFTFREEWLEELKKVSHRDYTSGFFPGLEKKDLDAPPTTSYIQDYRFVGLVKDYLPLSKEVEVEVRNRMRIGERVEIFGPKRGPLVFNIEKMRDGSGVILQEAIHPQEIIYLTVPQEVEKFSLIRKEE